VQQELGGAPAAIAWAEEERRYAREEEGGGGGEEEAAPRAARGGEEGERAEARHEALENFAEKQVREVAPVTELRRVRLRRCGLQEELRRFHGGSDRFDRATAGEWRRRL